MKACSKVCFRKGTQFVECFCALINKMLLLQFIIDVKQAGKKFHGSGQKVRMYGIETEMGERWDIDWR
ncbi:hypothetical protein [Eisenbergiella massiliensis]|uniref:hypothetical protein n=1 Tax=Eisenbergiella massiliensis TaxID=1720294 RepID=UPI000C85FC90|nr:hypothetical protein [Eisenbergiella massiliensis]